MYKCADQRLKKVDDEREGDYARRELISYNVDRKNIEEAEY